MTFLQRRCLDKGMWNCFWPGVPEIDLRNLRNIYITCLYSLPTPFFFVFNDFFVVVNVSMQNLLLWSTCITCLYSLPSQFFFGLKTFLLLFQRKIQSFETPASPVCTVSCRISLPLGRLPCVSIMLEKGYLGQQKRNFHPLSPTFIYLHSLSPTFIHNKIQFSLTFINLKKSFSFIYSHPLSPTFIHSHKFSPISSIITHYNQLLSFLSTST